MHHNYLAAFSQLIYRNESSFLKIIDIQLVLRLLTKNHIVKLFFPFFVNNSG